MKEVGNIRGTEKACFTISIHGITGMTVFDIAYKSMASVQVPSTSTMALMHLNFPG